MGLHQRPFKCWNYTKYADFHVRPWREITAIAENHSIQQVKATMIRSRSSKVIDFGTNRKRACDFLLVRQSNLGPILYRFGDIARFSCSSPHPYSTLILGCSRWTRSPVLGSMWAGTVGYSAVKLFSKYSNLCENHASTSQTDGRTDGQTDDILWHHRALRSVAR